MRNTDGHRPIDIFEMSGVVNTVIAVLLSTDHPTIYESAIHGMCDELRQHLDGRGTTGLPCLPDTRDNSGRTLIRMIRDDHSPKTQLVPVMELLQERGATKSPIGIE